MSDSGVGEVRADVRDRHVRRSLLLLAILTVAVGWAGGLTLFAPAGSGGPQRNVAVAVPSPAATPPPASPPSPFASVSRTPSIAPSASAMPSRTTAPSELDPMFGMSGHLMWHDVGTAVAQLDMLAADGLGVIRFDVSWRWMEPSRGSYRYLDKLDQVVDAARARGIAAVLTPIETPAWANGGRSPWVAPDNPSDYASFVGMLAARYAGRVAGWEIWNEPDLRLFWRPDPDPVAYTRLLLAASAAIREADPSAKVIGGSITFGNTGFVQAMYDHGAKGAFDALSLHPYTLKHAPDDESDRFHSLTAILDDVHAVMASEGDRSTPIWITELGWAVVGLNSVSPDLRIDYLARSVPLIRQRPWVQVVTMYTIDTEDSERYGLSTGGRRSAAWRSYVDAVHASAP